MYGFPNNCDAWAGYLFRRTHPIPPALAPSDFHLNLSSAVDPVVAPRNSP